MTVCIRISHYRHDLENLEALKIDESTNTTSLLYAYFWENNKMANNSWEKKACIIHACANSCIELHVLIFHYCSSC